MTIDEEREFSKKISDNLDMSKPNILSLIIECNTCNDIEIRHSLLDDLLCQFLGSIGHNDMVLEFGREEKWYA